MYELPLAYMVIAHSQRDPGEYLLELQGFAAKSLPALQRHAIDAHLGRWPNALRHLMDAGEQHFGTALKLAQDKASR
jgi:elongator complex protein 1